MSSKKARRRKRQEQDHDRSRKPISPSHHLYPLHRLGTGPDGGRGRRVRGQGRTPVPRCRVVVSARALALTRPNAHWLKTST